MRLTEADILFDGQLPDDLDIPALWELGEPIAMPTVDMNGVEDSEEEGLPREMRLADGLLLRAHGQNHDLRDVTGVAELKAIIDSSSRHFLKLQRLGMCVVTHLTVAKPKPQDWERTDAGVGDDLAYSASRFVEDTQPLHIVKIARSISPEHARLAVIDPLRAYLDWCEAAKEPDILWDIFTSNQYAKQMTSGVVFLADIDPVISPVSEGVINDVREDLDLLEDYLVTGRS